MCIIRLVWLSGKVLSEGNSGIASLKKIQIPFREQVLVEIKVGDEVTVGGYADL